jgi:transcriptional regulator with XRE-family HTH domain
MGKVEYDAVRLGQRLRRARMDSHLSLRALAAEVGISPSALSQIENGKSQPSVTTLHALASELNASLDELLTDRAPRARTSDGMARRNDLVVRRAKRRALELATGVRWESLTAQSDPVLDFIHVTYNPGASSLAHGKLVRFPGRQYGFLLDGQLEVTVGDDTYELRPGDSIAFDSTDAHVVRNTTRRKARAVWILVRRDL